MRLGEVGTTTAVPPQAACYLYKVGCTQSQSLQFREVCAVLCMAKMPDLILNEGE